MQIQQQSSNCDNKLKCLRFDINNPDIKYILCKKHSTWRYLNSFSKDHYEEKELYEIVKKFNSQSEMDMWCAISGNEYEYVTSLNIIDV